MNCSKNVQFYILPQFLKSKYTSWSVLFWGSQDNVSCVCADFIANANENAFLTDSYGESLTEVPATPPPTAINPTGNLASGYCFYCFAHIFHFVISPFLSSPHQFKFYIYLLLIYINCVGELNKSPCVHCKQCCRVPQCGTYVY